MMLGCRPAVDRFQAESMEPYRLMNEPTNSGPICFGWFYIIIPAKDERNSLGDGIRCSADDEWYSH